MGINIYFWAFGPECFASSFEAFILFYEYQYREIRTAIFFMPICVLICHATSMEYGRNMFDLCPFLASDSEYMHHDKLFIKLLNKLLFIYYLFYLFKSATEQEV